MFGLLPPLHSDLVTDDASPQQIYALLRRERFDRMRASTIATQSDARLKSRKYYDKNHRKRVFNVDELVLVRVTDRRTKLQNRWKGNYRITDVNDDLYQIVNVDSPNEKLVRHGNDLKPFTQRSDADENTQVSFVSFIALSVLTTKTKNHKVSSKYNLIEPMVSKPVLLIILLSLDQLNAFVNS